MWVKGKLLAVVSMELLLMVAHWLELVIILI